MPGSSDVVLGDQTRTPRKKRTQEAKSPPKEEMVPRFRTGYLAFNGQDASLLHYHMAKYIACGFDSLTWCDVRTTIRCSNMNFGQHILAYSAPFWVHLTVEDTLAFFGQSDHCTTNMVRIAYSIWAFVKVSPNVFLRKRRS